VASIINDAIFAEWSGHGTARWLDYAGFSAGEHCAWSIAPTVAAGAARTTDRRARNKGFRGHGRTMDRKLLAACAGAASLSAAALAFAWHDHALETAPGELRPQAATPLPPAERCSWQQPDGSFVEAAEPLDEAGEAELAANRVAPAEKSLVAARYSSTADQPAVAARPSVEPEPRIEARSEQASPAAVRASSRGAQVVSAAVPDEALASEATADDFDESSAIAAPQSIDAPQMILPWAHANRYTPEMIAVLTRADDKVRHGFELADRGALFTARSEFIAALQIIAEANDSQQGTRMYSKALTSGLTALREAGVFVRHRANHSELNVERVVATHKTTILKDSAADELTATYAAQRYYTYAQEQLAAAAAREMNGSMALFGLAKTALSDVTNHSSQPAERTAQAMALFQAALLAEPNNFLAANELAVLEVRNGNLIRARELLMHSASTSNQRATWHNLAVVHARLGETALSEHAKAQIGRFAPPPSTGPTPSVKWLDPESFARTTAPSDGLVPMGVQAPTAGPAAAKPTPAQPSGNMAKKGASDWLPWSSRR
jgi:tetratricopeptide (TPR) repeat protein